MADSPPPYAPYEKNFSPSVTPVQPPSETRCDGSNCPAPTSGEGYSRAMAATNGKEAPSEKIQQTRDELEKLGATVELEQVEKIGKILTAKVLEKFKENPELKQKIDSLRAQNPQADISRAVLAWYRESKTISTYQRSQVIQEISSEVAPLIQGRQSLQDALVQKIQETTKNWESVPAEFKNALKNPTSVITTAFTTAAIVHIFSQEGGTTDWRPFMATGIVASVLTSMPSLIKGNEGFLVGSLIGGKVFGWNHKLSYALGAIMLRPEAIAGYAKFSASLVSNVVQSIDLGISGDTKNIENLWGDWVYNKCPEYGKTFLDLKDGGEGVLKLSLESEMQKDATFCPEPVQRLLQHHQNIQRGKPGLNDTELAKAVKEAGNFLGSVEGLVTEEEYSDICIKRVKGEPLTEDEKKKSILGSALNLKLQFSNPENPFVSEASQEQFATALAEGQKMPLNLDQIPFKDAQGKPIDFSKFQLTDFRENPQIKYGLAVKEARANGVDIGNYEFLQGSTRTFTGTALTVLGIIALFSYTVVGIGKVSDKIRGDDGDKKKTKKIDTDEQKPLNEKSPTVYEELTQKIKGQKTVSDIYALMVTHKIIAENATLTTNLAGKKDLINFDETDTAKNPFFANFVLSLKNQETTAETLRKEFLTGLKTYDSANFKADAEALEAHHQAKLGKGRLDLFVKAAKKKDKAIININGTDYEFEKTGWKLLGSADTYAIKPKKGGDPLKLSFTIKDTPPATFTLENSKKVGTTENVTTMEVKAHWD